MKPMKPEDVPDAWVERAAQNMLDCELGRGTWEQAPEEQRERWRARAFDALAAVIPLVQKEEREACRREAVAVAHAFPQDDPRHETGWVVADAIRARGRA